MRSSALPAGNFAAGRLVAEAGAVAHDANDFILYDTSTRSLSCDPDGSGAQATMHFATPSGHRALATLDIWVR
ncbi:MAG: hypothetical protein V5B40_08885 [Candidatus Accumulibacter meliphilus]|jgi:Ca2+-binding RTX toxin-like protein|uniref:hypothetical protein n=1 Tax=Candidatus Accumulibacter meliphilus TaxID=2211374 RepID=UPI002FC38628